MAALADDAGELLHSFQKARRRIFVLQLFRDERTPAQHTAIALTAALRTGCLRNEQVAGMMQKRTFVEMPLERPAQETQIVFPDVGTIPLLNENILLVHHGIVRKHLHRFEPYAVQRFIFLRRDGE